MELTLTYDKETFNDVMNTMIFVKDKVSNLDVKKGIDRFLIRVKDKHGFYFEGENPKVSLFVTEEEMNMMLCVYESILHESGTFNMVRRFQHEDLYSAFLSDAKKEGKI